MIYKLFILHKAQKQLAKLPADDYKKLKKIIAGLARNPRPTGTKKLKGRNAWRIRQGNYRVIYEIQDNILTITVIALGHRKDIYK